MLWKLNLLQFEFEIWSQSFKRKIVNKTNLWRRSLIDQEWHIALEMPTSEMAHTEKEREHACKTKIRKNLSN
jgi:hypothetical protein